MLFSAVGVLVVAGVTVVGVRLLSCFHSFLLHWRRYRALDEVSTADLRRLDLPFVRLHWTTRGGPGSTEVVVRGIRHVQALAAEDPGFYARLLRVEVCTESAAQARAVERQFLVAPVPVEVVVLPPAYRTPNGTEKKARALHHMVERRRAGWGRRPGRTFVVHYDQESVIEPAELRTLLRCLAGTDKSVLAGPVYYPLDYASTSVVCRAMEANRPIGCFESRSLMERGTPWHPHGSNLVVEEEFENELGWDMGCLDGQPFVAEDYVFGVQALFKGGSEAFGWHGAVMLEQPPFSYRSAFRQRGRWITGVLQGQVMLRRSPEFRRLAAGVRARLVWGTRFRILTSTLGLPLGVLSLLYVPWVVATTLLPSTAGAVAPLPFPLMLWLAAVGFMWLASVLIGAWYNVAHSSLSPAQRWTELARILGLAPVTGILESAGGLWALLRWLTGRRAVSWHPTPTSRAADLVMDWSSA